ncbi:MAG: hypothetical protein MZU91_02950 [Desulfosudis oleivorans]|nr:hypothetical protein [Desulfosudis oleivorans]
MKKRRIDEPLDLGIRSINGLPDRRKGPAHGHHGGLRRGQERAARHDGPPHQGRCERDRAHR